MKRTFYKSYGLYSLQELEEMEKDYKEQFMSDIEDLEEEDIKEAVINYLNQGWECFIDEITYNNLGTIDCIIEGVLGLWNGKHIIQPVYANLEQCITKCISDSDEVEIYEEDGQLKIDAYHHDGTNHFIIRLENGLPLNLMNKIYGV